jgi:putative hemolysin
MTELALVSVRPPRLAVLEQQGLPGAATARGLAEDPQRFLPTVQVGITLVGILAGVFGGARLAGELAPVLARIRLLTPIADELSLAMVVVLITYLTMVLGELVPKQLALRHPERIAAFLARPVALLARIGAPAVWLLAASSGLILRALGANRPVDQSVTEEELRAVLAEGAQTGVLETEEHEMIGRLLRLADKPVRAIMTPRTELAWIDQTDPEAEILAALKAAPYSRFVVCDGSIDNPIGVLRAKDLLDRYLDGQPLSIAQTVRTAPIVPDTVTALDALERLRGDERGLALVMDEYGSFEGVVTATDVLRSIVGDPSDSTTQAPGPTLVAGGLVAEGMMPVDELKARLNLPDLPNEGSYHTVGGLLLALLRRVPRVGDRIVFAGWRFEVLEMDDRRTAKVRISREPIPES